MKGLSVARRGRLGRGWVMCGLLWWALGGCVFGASAAGAQGIPTAVVPPLTWHDRTLDNGLRVLALEQHGSPDVAIQLWYRVGGRNDPPGRAGFAHLFEHLMFKRTRYLVDEQFDRMTEDVGGENNAFTAEDVTVYLNRVPANHLEPLLWAEAERMANLQVDEANFVSERDVVKEELRQRVLADPYGAFQEAMSVQSFQVHPYRRPVIGSIEALDAATLAEVQAFHRAWYRPDNAVLIVVGDFDPDQLNAWVDRYFAPIPRPQPPLAHRAEHEPPRTASRTVRLSGTNAPLPAVAISWLAPPVTHEDAPALQILGALLAGTSSSRLERSLVHGSAVARTVGFNVDLRAEAGALVAWGIAAQGRPPQDLKAGLLREVEALVRAPVAEAELARIRTRLLAAALTERETAMQLALALGQAAVVEADAQRLNTGLNALRSVTLADVQRVARTYLSAPTVTIEYAWPARRP